MQTNLDRITTDLLNLRSEGASGLKLNKPSDDPGAIRPVLSTRTQLQQNDRYLETMGHAGDKMAATDSHLSQVENILVRAKEIAINAIDSALNDSDLASLAGEIGELKNELLARSNAVIDGKYIFAGYQEDTKPFIENMDYDPGAYDADDVSTWPVIYQGDHHPTELEITPGEVVEVNLTGNEIFLGVPNGIAETGYPDPIDVPAGSMDLFTVMTKLEEAISAGNVDDINGEGGSIQAQLENVELAANQNRTMRSQLGFTASRVESAIAQQESARVDLEQILSRYQDVDMIENFNDIVEKETAFQAALNITSRVSQISILDYF